MDVNNGDLSGYNLDADARMKLGAGNINKVRTNGFFYVTEVWEDSLMPDEEGITPQGLGSPASRDCREFENIAEKLSPFSFGGIRIGGWGP